MTAGKRAAGPSLQALLDALHGHGIVRLGPAEHIDVEALLRSRQDWPRCELRAALASLLATRHEQWLQIARLFDLYFPETQEITGGAQIAHHHPPAADTGQVSSVAEPPGRPRRARGGRLERMRVALRNAPRTLWLALIALALGAAIALLVGLLAKPPNPPVEKQFTAFERPPESPREQRWRLRPKPLIPKRTVAHAVRSPPRAPDWRDGLAILIGLLMLLIALRWLFLPSQVQRLRARQRRHRQQRAARSRNRLAEQAERQKTPLHLSYQVKRFPPLPDEAAEDSATVLGRHFRTVAGEELDVPATVRVSIAAGGRLIPVYAPTRAPQALILLVDKERGDYPWLGGVEWLLERWRALGVHFARFDFQTQPTFLAEQGTGAAVSLQRLARRSEGEPLLVIARSLGVEGLGQAPPWLTALEAWPCKAWLDPDPRPLSERRHQRRSILALEALGLRRFSFSHAGLVALARYLAEEAPGPSSAPWNTLKPLNDPVVAAALPKWALLAALVPDATWNQLEALRRHFLELTQALPSPWYLQRLLQWSAQQNRTAGAEHFDPESADGRTLVLCEALIEKLIRAQRQQDAELPEDQQLEVRARQLLLAQLDATRPEHELLRQFWEVKRLSHWLRLDPERALEGLAPLMGSAAEPELIRAVELERERQQATPLWDRAVREHLDLVAGRAGNRVGIGELLGSPWRAWRQPVLIVAAMVAAAAVLGGLLTERLRDGLLRPAPSTSLTAVLPVIHKVERAELEFQDTLADGSKGPVMVRIPGGCFSMGSPLDEQGRGSDEQPHQMCVEDFAVGKYEVTIHQFERFVRASDYQTEAEIDGGCYGVDDSGNWPMDSGKTWRNPGFPQDGRHPVVCVSWKDARAYARWLAEQTGEAYRLLTEAEWEYAARGGSSTARYWGNDPNQACEYANVADETARKRYPWNFHECDDGHLYTAPVGRFAANAYGLQDMLGNVWEWTCSVYMQNYDGSEKTCAEPRSQKPRVLRGGSWYFTPGGVRAAFRGGDEPNVRYGLVGFRLARD